MTNYILRMMAHGPTADAGLEATLRTAAGLPGTKILDKAGQMALIGHPGTLDELRAALDPLPDCIMLFPEKTYPRPDPRPEPGEP
jgi:hypothetical protein